jgi:hypothetical protein
LKTNYENFYLYIYFVRGFINYSDFSPSIEIINLYPAFPRFESYLVILSQSTKTSFGKFLIIILTKVDFPVAMPPVNPNILTVLNFLPIRYMAIHGKRVVKKGLIP